MSVWRQTGVKPAALNEVVELPKNSQAIWKIFIDLHNARTNTGFGTNPIQYSEIQAYTKLYEIELEYWEIDLLRQLDQVVLTFYQEEAEKQKVQK